MIEETFCSADQTESRHRRAFGWIVSFRDFAANTEQKFKLNQSNIDAVTFLCKGHVRAFLEDQFWLETTNPGDSSDSQVYAPQAKDKTWKFVYATDTTRVCIFKDFNKGQLPKLTTLVLDDGQSYEFPVGYKGLVCTGSLEFENKTFDIEKNFTIVNGAKIATARGQTFILDFTNDK